MEDKGIRLPTRPLAHMEILGDYITLLLPSFPTLYILVQSLVEIGRRGCLIKWF
jgi:hypothetical protein